MTPIYRNSDDEFIAAVKGARSYSEIARRLGLNVGGSQAKVFKRRIERLGDRVDASALIGKPGISHNPRRRGFYRKPLEDLTDLGNIKSRLIHQYKWEHKCSRCEISIWLGEELPLEVDHIDGNSSNNVLTNLRFLCPNCHSLTPTWRGRNRKLKR